LRHGRRAVELPSSSSKVPPWPRGGGWGVGTGAGEGVRRTRVGAAEQGRGKGEEKGWHAAVGPSRLAVGAERESVNGGIDAREEGDWGWERELAREEAGVCAWGF
jgi:hypothetical protein